MSIVGRIIIRQPANLLLSASWHLERGFFPIGSGGHCSSLCRYLCFLVRHDRESANWLFSRHDLTIQWFGRRKIFITGLVILTALYDMPSSELTTADYQAVYDWWHLIPRRDSTRCSVGSSRFDHALGPRL
jgi:hypothetical protein